jgi:transcriptional regulator with XRE-family HTH domain
MTDIYKNLKKLRLLRSLTQEEVAQKIGLTRQAISSYESGRTQPSIDLLMKFAEIYEVTLDDILYGKRKEDCEEISNKELKRMQVIFAIVVVGWILFRVLQIVMLVMADGAYLPRESVNSVVIDSQQMKEAIDLRFYYLDIAYRFESLAQQILWIGGLILLVLDLVAKKTISVKNKWKIIGLLILVSFGIGSVGGIVSPIQKANLMLPVYISIIIIVLLITLDTIGQWIKKRLSFTSKLK